MTAQGWVYLGVALVCWRYFAGFLHQWESDQHDYHPAMAVFTGAVGALFWPIVVAITIVVTLCLRWPDAMHRLFIHEPSRARRQRRLSRVRAETERLERELRL